MSQRPEQLAELIHHQLDSFLVKEVEFPFDSLVTMLRVKVTPDLKHAYLYISVLPISQTGKALKILEKNLGRARHFLSQQLKLRKCPDLKVVVDDSSLKDRKIERALDNLKK